MKHNLHLQFLLNKKKIDIHQAQKKKALRVQKPLFHWGSLAQIKRADKSSHTTVPLGYSTALTFNFAMATLASYYAVIGREWALECIAA